MKRVKKARTCERIPSSPSVDSPPPSSTGTSLPLLLPPQRRAPVSFPPPSRTLQACLSQQSPSAVVVSRKRLHSFRSCHPPERPLTDAPRNTPKLIEMPRDRHRPVYPLLLLSPSAAFRCLLSAVCSGCDFVLVFLLVDFKAAYLLICLVVYSFTALRLLDGADVRWRILFPRLIFFVIVFLFVCER